MNLSFFKPLLSVNKVQLMRDILRVVRDVLAVANNFFHLKMISRVIDIINLNLGDQQNNPNQL